MKLTKIKLINWHLFSNNTIELKGNTLLSGENGTGKSTLVDAIYYVLSAGDEKHFNHAASQNAKRTLEAYMRYKTGLENKKYFRSESEVISHIALEYENEKGNEYFVVGVCLELSSGNTRPQVHFYFADKYRINDSDYITNGKICNHIELKNHINNYDSWDKYNISKRKEILAKDVFKLSSKDKYYDLLAKAIAFKPIEEVSSFVNNFLLKDNPVDLDSLRTDMRNYNEIHKIIIREELKLNSLESFVHKAEDYQENKKIMKYLDIVKVLINIEDANKLISDCESEINKIDKTVSTNKDTIASLQKQSEELTKEIYSYENNEEIKALKQKEERLSIQNRELNTLNEQICNYDKIAKDENVLAQSVGIKMSFYDDYQRKDYPSFNNSIKKYKEKLDDASDKALNLKAELNIRIKELSADITETNRQLDNIRKGIKNYDPKLSNLIDIIKKRIYDTKKKNVEVVPFVEYLEIKKGEEEWKNALEGYLNTQRFDLIIDPQYYIDAIRIYESVKDKLGIYNYGIVDVKKIEEQKEIKDSLYLKLDISNKYAKKYAQLLLNNVICVNDVEDLNKHKVSITKTGMVYKNYCVRAINKAVWEIPFIGRDSLKQQEKVLLNHLDEINKEQTDITKKMSTIAKVIEISKKTQAFRLIEMEDLWSKLNTLSGEVARLIKEVDEDKNNKSLISINQKLERAKTTKRNVEKEAKDLDEENTNLATEKGGYDNNINVARETIKNNQKEYDEKIILIKQDNSVYVDYLNRINNYRNGDRFNKSLVLKDYESADKTNRALYNGIQNGMQNYSKDFKPDLTAIFDNLEDYIDEYYRIKNMDIVKFREQANEAYERSREGFRQVFLIGIRTRIEDAKAEINKINKILKNHPFSGDTYSFVCDANKELGEYYRIITSGKELESKDLFTDTLNEADSKLIEELFNKVSSSDDSNEKYIQKYLDYREYMRYDIKVVNEAGEPSYISETAREKSGGETQTPFYVVIAACFDELMSKDKKDIESCCMAIFDEAFNNMDEGRIQAVLNFYKQLSIQLFIVVPGIRTYSIAPYMDSVIGITKIDNKAVLFHEAGK
ncbi:MAG: hypothetical protein IJP63_00315 [Acholeplasmatales bacterium]|nr:hypothetical protein [Acholeplasmatales bacterium]